MKQRECMVYFPLIHDQESHLVAVRAFFRGEQYLHPYRFGANAACKKRVFEDLLSGSRFTESTQTQAQAVSLDFNPIHGRDIHGQSYFLAAALADKLVRFYPEHQAMPSMVIATGEIVMDSLEVLAVGELTGKLRLLIRLLSEGKIPKGTWFFYPKKMILTLEQSELLHQLEQQQVHCIPVNHFNELEWFWMGKSTTKKVQLNKDMLWILILLAMLWVIGHELFWG
jgi:hypothetical protein